ncbi:MAG: hypothetical protein PHC91_05330 [Eubacteriales bacterium]|nr:hypothetical protein [Eubacteriales bacterium]
MAFEDIKRNAKRDIESDIKEYETRQRNQATYRYIQSKIELAAAVSLITDEETKEYMEQISSHR